MPKITDPEEYTLIKKTYFHEGLSPEDVEEYFFDEIAKKNIQINSTK